MPEGGLYSRRGNAMTSEDNGNVIGVTKPTSSSNEDLSEYTDADESISAPTEILAEFLSAVMLKDYVTALKYCKMILQYEPNNATAKDFYPIIIDKLTQLSIKNDSNSNSNDSEDEERSETSATSESESSATDETSEDQEDEEEDVEPEEEAVASGGGTGDNKGSKGSDGDATTGSYSSLEDDDAGDAAVAMPDYKTTTADDVGNGNTLYSLGGLASNTAFQNKLTNSNTMQSLPFGTSSDSESPTEPITQQTVALLRARIVPN